MRSSNRFERKQPNIQILVASAANETHVQYVTACKPLQLHYAEFFVLTKGLFPRPLATRDRSFAAREEGPRARKTSDAGDTSLESPPGFRSPARRLRRIKGDEINDRVAARKTHTRSWRVVSCKFCLDHGQRAQCVKLLESGNGGPPFPRLENGHSC